MDGKDVIKFIIQKCQSLEARVAELEHTVNDVVVKSLVEANDQYEYDTGLEAFRSNYPDVASLDPKMKALYGDDYDTAKAMFDARPSEYGEGEDEASWVAGMLAEINAKLDALAGLSTEEVPTEEAPVEEEVSEEVTSEEEPAVSEEQLRQELLAARGEA